MKVVIGPKCYIIYNSAIIDCWRLKFHYSCESFQSTSFQARINYSIRIFRIKSIFYSNSYIRRINDFAIEDCLFDEIHVSGGVLVFFVTYFFVTYLYKANFARLAMKIKDRVLHWPSPRFEKKTSGASPSGICQRYLYSTLTVNVEYLWIIVKVNDWP